MQALYHQSKQKGLPSSVCVVFCAFIISVSAYELKVKFRAFKSEENEMVFAMNGPIFFVGLVVYPK